jgi:hypothetical protein
MIVQTLVRLSLICPGYGGVADYSPRTLRFAVNWVRSEWTNVSTRCP